MISYEIINFLFFIKNPEIFFLLFLQHFSLKACSYLFFIFRKTFGNFTFFLIKKNQDLQTTRLKALILLAFLTIRYVLLFSFLRLRFLSCCSFHMPCILCVASSALHICCTLLSSEHSSSSLLYGCLFLLWKIYSLDK